MSVFPKLGILNEKIKKTMEERAGNNLLASKLSAWVRISSAVDGGLILESVPKKLNSEGNTINSSFEDFYGNSTKSGRVGLDMGGKSVYAEGEDRGYRPSPLVDSISIENGTSGLSRKAKFNIICYTLPQTEIITKHFLEPGYTVLVEFGWNLPSSLQQKDPVTPCYIASFNNYNFITDKRVNSNGTYDGFMGFITGGSYSSGDDETYIVTVELTTLGEIPSYLQVQKTAVSNNSNSDEFQEPDTSQEYRPEEIESNGDNSDKIGDGLFKQVYNRLPNEKRTLYAKDLLLENDVLGNPFSSEWNFINTDESVRNRFMSVVDSIQITSKSGDESNIDIPSGTSFITDQSFIRMELAFKILNLYGIQLEPSINTPEGMSCGGNTPSNPSYNYTIATNDTILRAHKHMYSTDINKLYIPNTNLPEFGLNESLYGLREGSSSDFIDVNNPTVINGNMWAYSGKENFKKYEFPSTEKLKMGTDVNPLKDVNDVDAQPFTWGYLRNLYVNLNFFLEVISRSNFVAKDCYYELLNGISSATNSYWQFELQERPAITTINGTEYSVHQMEVVEQTFTGEIRPSFIEKVSMFDPVGTNTPFLTSNFTIDIPAAMKNSILGKRSSLKLETNTDGQGMELGLFSNKPDPVMQILDSFKEPAEPITQKPVSSGATVGDIRKRNLEKFSREATLLITIRDKSKITSSWASTETAALGRDFVVGTFSDTTLLKRFELAFMNNLSSDAGGKTTSNPAILSIEFTFDTLGISGIKVGDVFRVDKLPKKYTSGIFQVTETSHQLSDSQWVTSVTAKMRNINI